MKTKCDHYWAYPHSVFQGRRTGEVAVCRYCHKCGKKQISYCGVWKKVPLNYDSIHDCVDEARGINRKD